MPDKDRLSEEFQKKMKDSPMVKEAKKMKEGKCGEGKCGEGTCGSM